MNRYFLPLLSVALLLAQAAGHAKTSAPALKIEPAQVRLRLGQEFQFHGKLEGGKLEGGKAEGGAKAIHWSVEGKDAGSISGEGFYHAPNVGATPATCRVVATVEGSPELTAEARVFIQPVALAIAPKQAALLVGQSHPFRAQVQGVDDPRVLWSVDGGEGHGRVSPTGIFSVPVGFPTPGTITVRATSVADPSRSAIATVHVGKVALKVTPKEVKLKHGGSHRFTAKVEGTAERGITWSVAGEGQGQVSSSGLYTMPASMATPAMVTIVARSIADPSKTAIARVRVDAIQIAAGKVARKHQSTLSRMAKGAYRVAAPHVVRLLMPFDPVDLIVGGPDFVGRSGKQYVPLGGRANLNATIANSSNDAVKWDIVSPNLGEITQDGTYRAPESVTTPQVIQVRATSLADTTKTVFYTLHIPPVVIQPDKENYVCPLDNAVQLHAKAENTENDHLTWKVEGGEQFGTISETGLYRPPAEITTPAVVRVRATSVADPTKSTVIQVNIPAAKLEISPDQADVRAGRSLRFKTHISGFGESGTVTWKLTPQIGTISSSGIYLAPEKGGDQVVQVIAALKADPTKTAAATIRVRSK